VVGEESTEMTSTEIKKREDPLKMDSQPDLYKKLKLERGHRFASPNSYFVFDIFYEIIGFFQMN
jgi:hypothetical protein